MITTITLNPSIDKLYRVDEVHLQTVMRVREVSNTAGGKGLNVTKVAALLGEPVTATGLVGGYNGGYLVSLLQGEGITAAFTKTESETRSCINIWSGGKSTEFLEPGKPVTTAEIERFEADFLQAMEPAQVVTISGSLPAGVPTDYYSHLISVIKAAGKQVIVDTSGQTLASCLACCPTMIKPNEDEIRQITGANPNSMQELAEAARALHHRGIPYVAVSMGKDGVLLACEEGVLHAAPPALAVVNTVGCGDSMVAGFAVAFARGYSPREAVRCAVAVSAAGALTKETGGFIKSDFTELLSKITITEYF